MSEFFSLGGGREETTNNHNWLLYKNHNQELLTYRDFELCQQQHNHDEQYYQFLRNPIINPFELDIGPSHNNHDEPNNSRSMGANFMMMSSSTSNNSTTISCQDCGNQAKKDCQHMRCRTCCKSRGFQCQTHVKSTWVPAAKRREKQQQEQEDDNQPKRQKDDPITGLEVGNFPSKINSIAVFQRVRMSSIEETEDQIAYQAVVNIAGHIFKGILYDQGDHDYNYMNVGDSSSGGDPLPHQHNLIIGTATSAANDMTGVRGSGSPSAAATERTHFLEPFNTCNMVGTQFFPPPRA